MPRRRRWQTVNLQVVGVDIRQSTGRDVVEMVVRRHVSVEIDAPRLNNDLCINWLPVNWCNVL